MKRILGIIGKTLLVILFSPLIIVLSICVGFIDVFDTIVCSNDEDCY